MSHAPNRSFFKFLADLIMVPFTKFMVVIGAWTIEVVVNDSREIVNEINEIPTKIEQYTDFLSSIYLFAQKITRLLGGVPDLILNIMKNLIVFLYVFCALILVGRFDWLLDSPLSLISISIVLTYLTYRE